MKSKQAKSTDKPAKAERPKLRQYSRKPLTAVPNDFDPAKHSRLTRAQFASAATYWDWRAVQFGLQMRAATAKAKAIRESGGSREERRVTKLVGQLRELRDVLAKDGVDVNLAEMLKK